MFTVFNIVVILLVLLIAYWWANQGLFSALLHLICVIAAGAVALGVWEPLTVGLLLRGSAFDNYAWGVSLIGVFVVVLLILRVIMDKTITANVDIPNWANLTFGFPTGAAAGVLTVGIFLLGAGFIQSTRAVMGFDGWARSVQDGTVDEVDRLWAPVHEWTAEFYSLLSVGSLYPTFEQTPLRRYYPDLHAQAASLVRDSASNGQGKLSLKPSDARIAEVLFGSAGNQGKYAVRVMFEPGARDYGELLTLSQSQVRLISDAQGFSKPKVAFPELWTQHDGWHKFDDISHYVTSEPGQSQANIVFFFSARDLGDKPPKFMQIRGTRYRLPRAEEITADKFAQLRGSGSVAISSNEQLDANARSIQSAIEQSNSIRPIMASTNQKPAGIDVSEDKHIIGGDGDFLKSGGERPSRSLIIKGIIEPTGTRIVQVTISRESPANIFGSVSDQAGEAGQLKLVDSDGRAYWPVGFLHDKPDNKTRIKVDFQNYIRTLGELPRLPTSGEHVMRLFFSVTDGVTITGFKCGDVTVGTCSLLVKDPKAPDKPAEPKPNADPTAPTTG